MYGTQRRYLVEKREGESTTMALLLLVTYFVARLHVHACVTIILPLNYGKWIAAIGGDYRIPSFCGRDMASSLGIIFVDYIT